MLTPAPCAVWQPLTRSNLALRSEADGRAAAHSCEPRSNLGISGNVDSGRLVGDRARPHCDARFCRPVRCDSCRELLGKFCGGLRLVDLLDLLTLFMLCWPFLFKIARFMVLLWEGPSCITEVPNIERSSSAYLPGDRTGHRVRGTRLEYLCVCRDLR